MQPVTHTHLPPRNSDQAGACHLSSQDDLLTLIEELGSGVRLTRLAHSENCDMFLCDDGIGWVFSGVLSKYVVRAKGQRRIVDLLTPGAFFNLDRDGARRFTVEATTEEAVIARSTRRHLHEAMTRSPRLYRFVYERACEAIARLEEHILVQGRTTAAEKVADYLLRLLARLPTVDGVKPLLPVSRYDIADHLGIAVETVSRAITELRREGLVELESPRRLAVKNAGRLAE